MPPLHLYNIQYTQLDDMTWCAAAQVTAPDPLNTPAPLNPPDSLTPPDSLNPLSHSALFSHARTATASLSAREIAQQQRQQQRAGVRLLLQSLLNKINISDTLDDSGFPYRLISSQYFVCFSHTGAHSKTIHSKSASTQRKNEKLSNDLSNKVAVVISAHRPAGIDIETNYVEWRVAQRFYHASEIAVLQTLSTMQRDTAAKLLWQTKESFIKIHQYKLAQGLGMDYSYLIADLINGSGKKKPPLIVIKDNKSDYRIALLLSQQIVIVY